MHLTLLHEQHYLCHRWLTILMLWRKWPAILLVLTHYIILHKVSQFTLHNLQRILFIRFIKASYTITSYNTWYLLRFIKVCFHVYTKYTINKGYCTLNFMHLSDLFKISNLTTIDFYLTLEPNLSVTTVLPVSQLPRPKHLGRNFITFLSFNNFTRNTWA